MPNAKHAQRLAIVLFAALTLVACSKESTEASAENPGHASGQHTGQTGTLHDRTTIH